VWRALPRRARAFHLGVVATSLGATAVSLVLGSWQQAPLAETGSAVAVVLVLMGATALSSTYGEVLGVRAGQRQILVMLSPAFHLAAALLLPLPWALTVPAVTLLTLQVRRRPALYKQAFNASVYVLGMVLAAPAFGLVLDGSRDPTRFVIAAVVACFVYGGVDVSAYLVYLRLAAGLSARDSGLVAVTEVASQLGFGVLLAALWHTAAILTVLILPIGVMLQRAVVFRSVERASRTEPKTGLLNDRAFQAVAQPVLRRAAQHGHSTGLLMLDLDLLRDINNTHGHLVGDLAIVQIADALRSELREQDLAARFGGEEFAVLLPLTTLAEAAVVAERIRARFAAQPLPAGAVSLPVSVSIGVCAVSGEASLERLMRSADAALYEAKRAGRDQVRTAAAYDVPEPRSAPLPSVPTSEGGP
jgi:diguanylate cyclase